MRRDRLAVWLCNVILRAFASHQYRKSLDKAIRTSLSVVALHASIEAVLFDHSEEIGGDRADANLTELAYIYERITGWSVAKEREPHGDIRG